MLMDNDSILRVCFPTQHLICKQEEGEKKLLSTMKDHLVYLSPTIANVCNCCCPASLVFPHISVMISLKMLFSSCIQYMYCIALVLFNSILFSPCVLGCKCSPTVLLHTAQAMLLTKSIVVWRKQSDKC